MLEQDPSVSLSILAQRTGGFLIDNTNALESGFHTIDADRRFHYLLTYTPTNDNFAGEWRTVTVRVPKRRVEVRARTGYQALRTPSAIPVLAWEVSALALLDRPAPPRDIPITVGVLTFPMNANESHSPLMGQCRAYRRICPSTARWKTRASAAETVNACAGHRRRHARVP